MFIAIILYNCSYKLHDVLHMMDDMDDDEVQGAEITILFPDNVGDDSDGDSGYEELLCNRNPDNMNRNQLLANACFRPNIRKPSGGLSIFGLEEDSDSNEECEYELQPRKHEKQCHPKGN